MANYSQRYNATTQTTTAGSFKFDTISGTDWPVAKLIWGAEGVATYASAADPLPVTISGVATAANQTTGNGLLATIDADTGAIATSVASIDSKILPDGHNVTVSGSVTANIGTVGTLATAAKQDTGNTSLSAIASSLAGTLTVASHAVTNAGVFAVQVDGSALTSLQLLDDSVATVGAAIVSKGMAAVGTDGTNARILKTDAAGELQIDVVSSALPTGAALESGGNLAAAATSLGVIDDAVYTSGGALGKVIGLGAWDANASGLMVAVQANSSGVIYTNPGNEAATDVTVTNAIPAGTNLIGKVSGSDETSTIYNGTTALTPKFAAIAASSSGNNTLIAAVASKKIRVLAYNFMGNGAVNAKFQSGAGGTDLTGLKYIAAAGGGICAPYNPLGWFETASNTLLNLNLSGAVAVGGEITYVEV
jgi:hypothetical protein